MPVSSLGPCLSFFSSAFAWEAIRKEWAYLSFSEVRSTVFAKLLAGHLGHSTNLLQVPLDGFCIEPKPFPDMGKWVAGFVQVKYLLVVEAATGDAYRFGLRMYRSTDW
jgi:hypothetical protein